MAKIQTCRNDIQIRKIQKINLQISENKQELIFRRSWSTKNYEEDDILTKTRYLSEN